MPGGILERSIEIYPYAGGKLKSGPPASWSFPSGARIDLRYIASDRDVLNYQGSEINLCCFDEVTMISEYAFTFMLSRNRSTSGLKPYVRMTCNPDADSWLVKWIGWYLNEQGFPIPERSGVIRYFVRIENELHWADTLVELKDEFPNIQPKSFTFVSAKITDNPLLLGLDPGYLSNLQALHPVDRARLLDGNWKVKAEAGKVFNRNWFEVVDAVPANGTLVRAWDMAGTEKTTKGSDPDFTAGVKILKAENGIFYVLDAIALQQSAATVNQLIFNAASQDGQMCKVRWEIEPGSAGKINSVTLTKMLSGYDAMGIRVSGDKLTRAKSFACQAAAGNVKLLRGDWNERYLSELHLFPDSTHDDIVDAQSLAFNELCRPPILSPPQAKSYRTW